MSRASAVILLSVVEKLRVRGVQWWAKSKFQPNAPAEAKINRETQFSSVCAKLLSEWRGFRHPYFSAVYTSCTLTHTQTWGTHLRIAKLWQYNYTYNYTYIYIHMIFRNACAYIDGIEIPEQGLIPTARECWFLRQVTGSTFAKSSSARASWQERDALTRCRKKKRAYIYYYINIVIITTITIISINIH